MLEGGSDDGEATELLTRMTDLRAQEAELFAAEQAALLEVLSPIQVLQMQSFREQIEAECKPEIYLSCVCSRGTRSCNVKHEGDGPW